MFEEKYNNLTGAEKENFKRITSLLLNRTFMVNRFYDKIKALLGLIVIIGLLIET